MRLKTKSLKLKTSSGFTIIELMVAMTLFLVLIGIAIGGFINALRTQRAIVELMAANDNASLTMEQIAREIRTGYHFVKVSDSEFGFTNAYNVTVFYRLNEGAIERGAQDIFLQTKYKKITADNLRVIGFGVNLLGGDAGDGYPPRITISLSITGKSKFLENVSVNVQTTISSRLLDT